MKIFRPLRTNLITQGFGLANTQFGLLAAYQAMGMKGHNGIDFSCYHEEPIYWPLDCRGTVTYTQDDPTAGVGCEVTIEQPEGAFKFQFWHFVMDGLKVKVGDILESGDLIGFGDSTGMSTGDHLHFGIKPQMKDEQGSYYTPNKDNGYLGCIDPSPYFTNVFIVDYKNSLIQQVGILQQLIEAIKKILGIK